MSSNVAYQAPVAPLANNMPYSDLTGPTGWSSMWGGSYVLWFVVIFAVTAALIAIFKPQFAQTRTEAGLGIPGTLNWGTVLGVSLIVALVLVLLFWIFSYVGRKSKTY